MKPCTLSAEEKSLCRLVSRASTVNHFTDERIHIDRLIAQCADSVDPQIIFEMEIARVHEFVETLVKAGRGDIRAYAGQDREWLELTFLFDVFHHFLSLIDQHINDQIRTGAKPLQVPFANDLLASLDNLGFSKQDSCDYMGLFFQLRRAYYFVVHQLVGSSQCMRHLRASLWNNVFTRDQKIYKKYLMNRMEDFSTLILGPTGTGKGTAAAAIGQSAFIPFDPKSVAFVESFTRAFIFLNLSQFSESLIESELFGHRKGAFTGAIEAHQGFLSRCSPYGSIFLDEIGDVCIPIQIKLLQVLQDRSFSPVGSHETMRFAGRVIAATNKDISHLRRQGAFRDDFYYRLCSDVISVPSLFQRIQESEQELSDLISHTTKRIIGSSNSDLTHHIRSVIENRLGKAYPWPGNVRELEQCVRRIILKGDYDGDFKRTPADPLTDFFEDIRNESVDADALLSRYCMILYGRYKSYEAVSIRTRLDRRTVKKYVDIATSAASVVP
jgi:DNA-binding NtrC family response regulator